MKAFIVDTVGTIVFFTVIAGLTELFIAGLDPKQVLIARLITLPVMVLTGRPYGIWRGWVFERLYPRRQLTVIATDVVAFLTFQVPVYIATLTVAGATLSETITAVGAAIIFMIALSRPFGLFLEALRKMTNVSVE